MSIKRHDDIPNLVRELAENRISPLEIIREALSNAKDHGASSVWINTAKSRPAMCCIGNSQPLVCWSKLARPSGSKICARKTE